MGAARFSTRVRLFYGQQGAGGTSEISPGSVSLARFAAFCQEALGGARDAGEERDSREGERIVVPRRYCPLVNLPRKGCRVRCRLKRAPAQPPEKKRLTGSREKLHEEEAHGAHV